MEGIFGTKAAMLHFHIAIGVFWLTTLLLYGIFGFKNYLLDFIKHDLVLDKDDIKWFPAKAKNLIGKLNHYEMPAQGTYNAGQKAYAVVVAISTVTINNYRTHYGFSHWLTTSYSVGNDCCILLPLCLYLREFLYMFIWPLFFPEERPAFFSMITGKVNEFMRISIIINGGRN